MSKLLITEILFSGNAGLMAKLQRGVSVKEAVVEAYPKCFIAQGNGNTSFVIVRDDGVHVSDLTDIKKTADDTLSDVFYTWEGIEAVFQYCKDFDLRTRFTVTRRFIHAGEDFE